jgi:alpha-tubulin suppressor-like RCC1 family protein
MSFRSTAPVRLLSTVTLVATLVLHGCGGGGGDGGAPVTPPPPPVTTTSVTIAPTSLSLTGVGATGQLTAVVNTSAGVATSPTVAWTSANPAVATVTGSGAAATVTSVSPGTVQITATSAGQSGSASITVNPAIQTLSVSVAPSALALTGVGATGQLTATVNTTAGVATAPVVTWASANPAVATVTGTGATATVTSVAPGTAQITATSGGQSGTAAVTVSPPAQTLTVAIAGDGTGSVTSTPAGLTCAGTACTGTFAFGSTVTLTAVPASGSALDAWSGACTGSASCSVTMSQQQSVTARFRRQPVAVATLTVTPAVVTLDEEGTAILSATARDAAGAIVTGRSITWRSSDTTVAVVSAAGVVSARTEGDTVRITATVDSVSATARVVVRSLFLVATEVTVGERNSCAVRPTEGVYCWGEQPLGSATSRPGGTRNLIDNSSDMTTVSLGINHGCAIAAGQVRCWGGNGEGQLANGRFGGGVVTPSAIVGAQQFSKIFSGFYQSCALTSVGRAFCWGNNRFGELGVGSGDVFVTQPTAVSGDQRFIALSVGGLHTCGIDQSGQALCWGNQGSSFPNRGALGDGSGTPKSTPTRVAGDRSWTSIAVGNAHTCAVDREGVAWCWGRNVEAQLGTGGTNPTLVPERVLGAVRFSSVTAGQVFSCGLATTGQLYCWGDNTYGQLGNGTTTRANQPVLVDAGSTRFRSVSASQYHVCAIDTRSRVHCWGWNNAGQTGRNGGSNDTRPALVGRP